MKLDDKITKLICKKSLKNNPYLHVVKSVYFVEKDIGHVYYTDDEIKQINNHLKNKKTKFIMTCSNNNKYEIDLAGSYQKNIMTNFMRTIFVVYG